MGCKVFPRLCELAPCGQRKPGGGFTQPGAHLMAHLWSVLNVIARQGFNFRGRLVLVCRALLFQRRRRRAGSRQSNNAFGTRKVHSAEVE